MKVKLPFCIILLMITSVVWADSKVLWRGSSSLCGGHSYSTPEAARKGCGYTRKGWQMEKRGEFTYEMGWYNEDGSFYKWTGAYILGSVKSCELKDIPGEGTNGAHNIGFRGDKAPKMVRRCINNCEVEDRRVSKYGESRDNDYGGAVCVELGNGEKLNCFADYTRIQTGAVCIQNPGEKDDTKYDDVTANPADDNGSNGADQTGAGGDGTKDKPDNPGQPPKQDGRDEGKSDGGGTGSDGSGNQNGGQGGTGADSPRDSGSADEPVEDKDKDKNKDKDKDKDKPGKGKGKGGGGGGKHGDKDKDDKDKTDDGKGGDPKGGEGKGDGKDGGKDGKDKADGSPNGTDNGTGAGGDKDGQGSGISGGDCKTGKAPQCKGET